MKSIATDQPSVARVRGPTWRYIRASALFVMVLTLVFLVSEALFEYLTKHLGFTGTTLKALCGAFTVSAVIAAFDKIRSFCERLWRHISIAEPLPRIGDSVSTIVALTGFGLSVLSFLNVEPMVAAGEQASVVDPRMTYLVRDNQPVAVFPFLFELASAPPSTKGVSLNKRQRDDLEKLVRSLEACVGEERGGDVVVQVRGFADSNEFPQDSGELNRQTANKRAAALYEAISALQRRPAQGTSSLILAPLSEWKTPEEMESARPYRDRPLSETGPTKDQGLFNRRAEVVLGDAGACAKLRKSQ
jgi:hypothetical protein